MDFITNIDISILEFIKSAFGCAFMDTAMPLVSLLAQWGVVQIGLAAVLLLIKKTRKTGAMMGLALILGFVIGNMIIKNAVGRIRPAELVYFGFFTDHLTDYSFPSGHSLAAFEIAGVLLMKNRKYGIIALVVSVFVSFSRLYLGVHYPSDVIGGALLGFFFGVFSVYAIDKIWKLIKKKNPKAAEFLGEPTEQTQVD